MPPFFNQAGAFAPNIPSDTGEEVTQNDLRLLDAKLQKMQSELDLMKNEGITRWLPVDQQDQMREIIGDGIANIVWGDFFHYATFFDTLDAAEDSGASVVSNRLFMSASGTNTVDYVRLRRVYQNLLNFDRESRFRSALDTGGSSSFLNTGSPMQDVELYLGTGSIPDGVSGNHIFDVGLGFNDHYGFYIEDDVLYGIASDGNGYSTVALSDVNVYDLFFVEAIHFPRDRVDFYVSDAVSSIENVEIKTPIYRGSVSTNLPSGKRTAMYECSVKNSDGTTGDKDMDVGFFEILQRK